jgi:hypothetical protein
MAGLDNYLATLKDNTGIAGGYQQGLRDRADLDTTLATLAQKQAETQRYTGETPSYLRKGEAGARTAELANVQGEADLAAGVPQQKAQENLMSAKQKAREAQQTWERLPQEHKAKMINAIKSKQMEMFDTIEQTLAQTSDVPGTIALIEQQYPNVTQDQGWNAAKQQVSNMSPQQAMNEIRKMKASMASSDAYGSPEMQGKRVLEDQQQAGREKIANIQGQFGLAGAQTRAASGGTGKQNAAEILLDLSTRYVQALQAGDTTTADQLLWQINAVKNTKPDEPSFAGFPGKPGTQVKPLDKSSSGVINLDEPQPQKAAPQTRPHPTAKKPEESKFKPLTDVSSTVDKAIKARDTAIEKEKADRKIREEEEALQRYLKRLEERQKAGEFSSTTTNRPYSGGRHNIN